jgi:KaiC/GvpD/RAD55 family RecA-like ATPase
MERVKTGISGLDKILGGGLPRNSSILLVGPPGCGKTTLCQQFVNEGLKEKQNAIYITLDSRPEDIKKSMKNLGWNVEKYKKLLTFIDCYSWRTGKPKEKYSISNLANVNELNICFSEAIENMNKEQVNRNVIDSISTLLLYADPTLVVKLIPIIVAKAKQHGFTQLLVLEEGVHDEKTVSTLNYIADGLITFKMEEDKRLMKVERMKETKHHRKWVEFEVTNKGIKI